MISYLQLCLLRTNGAQLEFSRAEVGSTMRSIDQSRTSCSSGGLWTFSSSRIPRPSKAKHLLYFVVTIVTTFSLYLIFLTFFQFSLLLRILVELVLCVIHFIVCLGSGFKASTIVGAYECRKCWTCRLDVCLLC